MAKSWRGAGLRAADAALCDFAEKLTLRPRQMAAADLAQLRQHGFNDAAIHDAVQVIGYFNYMNRLADALGVECESFIRPWEKSPNPDS